MLISDQVLRGMNYEIDLEKGIEKETSEEIQRGMKYEITITTTTTNPIPQGQGMGEVECRQTLPLPQGKPGSREAASKETSGKYMCAGLGMKYEIDLVKGIEKETSEEIQRLLDGQKNKYNGRNQHSQSICKTPYGIYSQESHKFPFMGIGLLHRWSNAHKIRYTYDLFQYLKSPPDDIRNECVHRVCSKFNQITACYGYNFDTIGPKMSSEMCMIIVVDACYILSLIYKWSQYIKHEGGCDKLLRKLQTKFDLIVQDNQIPFFVLQDLFECTILKLDPTASLVELILLFFKDISPFEANSITGCHGTHDTDYKHILDLLYKTYQPPDARSSDRLSTVTTTYSAVELRKAGVKFEPYQGDKWKMDIKFNSSKGNTTLTMPAMRIDYSTAPVLWNLSAYERCFPEVGNYIASYTFAMMMLVDTEKDLLELVESKVIRNPGYQYIVDTIHELCKGVVLKEFLFAEEWQKMNNYCNSRLGWTRRTYFRGAWSYIASVSALILFTLTAVQTYCSIRAL